MTAQLAEAPAAQRFPTIDTITKPDFPSNVRTLTARFNELKTQSRNSIAIGRGDGCMSSLVRFGKRLAEELQALRVALKYIATDGREPSAQSAPEQMSPDDVIAFLSQIDLPRKVAELVSTFCDAKERVFNPRIKRSAEFKSGIAAYCDLPTTNEFLGQAITGLEEATYIMSRKILDISKETATAAATATALPTAEAPAAE